MGKSEAYILKFDLRQYFSSDEEYHLFREKLSQARADLRQKLQDLGISYDGQQSRKILPTSRPYRANRAEPPRKMEWRGKGKVAVNAP